MTDQPVPTPSPKIAVIVPHYNDPVRLQACLTALAPQAAARPEAEIVVVDNDSPCDMAALAADNGFARFVTEPRKGAAAARNRGMAETTAPRVAFLDSDCIPAEDWLDTALRLAGSADLVGGRVDTFDETPPPRSGAEAFEAVFAFQQKFYVEKRGFSVTANLLTSRAVFDDVGPMVVGRAEDVDWCHRARARGYKLVYADDLVVRHPTRQDWPALRRKLRRTTDELFHQNGTGPLRRLAWAGRAVAVLGSAAVHAPRVCTAPQLSTIERRRGLATLLRQRATRCGWMLRQAATGR